MKFLIEKVGLIFIMLVTQVLYVYGQSNTNTLTKQKAVEDFCYFVDLLESTHVDPYKPIGGKLNFEVRVAQYKKKIEKSVDDKGDLSMLINEFVAYLKDNHTRIDTNKNTDWSKNKQLPFYCKSTEDAIYINAIKNDFSNLYGAKIISINNLKIDSLLILSSQLQTAENTSNLKANLCRQIINLNTAQRLFSNLDSSLVFCLVSENLDTIQQKFDFLTNQELRQLKWKQKPKNIKVNTSGIFSHQFLDNEKDIMYFRMREMFAQEVVEMIDASNANHGNWVSSMLRYYPKLRRMKDKEKAIKQMPYFSEAFRNMLDEMKDHKSEYLILDLSDNPGGYSSLVTPALYMMYGDTCFSRAVDRKGVLRVSELFLDKYDITIEEYNKRHGTSFNIGDYNISDFTDVQTSENCLDRRKKYLENLVQNGYGWSKYIDDLNGKAIYTPKIIVITSAGTNSAAFHFLYSLYKIDNITVIGTSPKQAGNTPMEGTPLELPNSGITGSISNSYQILFPTNDEKAEIFTPDFPITWQDLQKKEMSSTSTIEIAVEFINNEKLQPPNN